MTITTPEAAVLPSFFPEPPLLTTVPPDLVGNADVRVVVVTPSRINGGDGGGLRGGEVLWGTPQPNEDGSWSIPAFGDWFATVQNPEPQAGHYYRLVTTPRLLVRYEEGGRWAIVGGENGEPHLYENDALLNAPSSYYEVVDPNPAEAAVEAEPAVEEPAPEVADVPAPTINVAEWRGAVSERLVKVEDDGSILAVTEFQDGQQYITRDPADRRTYHFGVKLEGEEQLHYMGYYSTYYGSFESGGSERDLSGAVWANVRPPEQPSLRSSSRGNRMIEEIEREDRIRIDEFEKLNDALNVLAAKKSWCSEYEGVMTRNNMRGRGDKFTGALPSVTVMVAMNNKKNSDHPLWKGVQEATGMTLADRFTAYFKVENVTIEVEARSASPADYINYDNVQKAVFAMHEEQLRSLGVDGWEELAIENWVSVGVEWTKVDAGKGSELTYPRIGETPVVVDTQVGPVVGFDIAG